VERDGKRLRSSGHLSVSLHVAGLAEEATDKGDCADAHTVHASHDRMDLSAAEGWSGWSPQEAQANPQPWMSAGADSNSQGPVVAGDSDPYQDSRSQSWIEQQWYSAEAGPVPSMKDSGAMLGSDQRVGPASEWAEGGEASSVGSGIDESAQLLSLTAEGAECADSVSGYVKRIDRGCGGGLEAAGRSPHADAGKGVAIGMGSDRLSQDSRRNFASTVRQPVAAEGVVAGVCRGGSGDINWEEHGASSSQISIKSKREQEDDPRRYVEAWDLTELSAEVEDNLTAAWPYEDDGRRMWYRVLSERDKRQGLPGRRGKKGADVVRGWGQQRPHRGKSSSGTSSVQLVGNGSACGVHVSSSALVETDASTTRLQSNGSNPGAQLSSAGNGECSWAEEAGRHLGSDGSNREASPSGLAKRVPSTAEGSSEQRDTRASLHAVRGSGDDSFNVLGERAGPSSCSSNRSSSTEDNSASGARADAKSGVGIDVRATVKMDERYTLPGLPVAAGGVDDAFFWRRSDAVDPDGADATSTESTKATSQVLKELDSNTSNHCHKGGSIHSKSVDAELDANGSGSRRRDLELQATSDDCGVRGSHVGDSAGSKDPRNLEGGGSTESRGISQWYQRASTTLDNMAGDRTTDAMSAFEESSASQDVSPVPGTAGGAAGGAVTFDTVSVSGVANKFRRDGSSSHMVAAETLNAEAALAAWQEPSIAERSATGGKDAEVGGWKEWETTETVVKGGHTHDAWEEAAGGVPDTQGEQPQGTQPLSTGHGSEEGEEDDGERLPAGAGKASLQLNTMLMKPSAPRSEWLPASLLATEAELDAWRRQRHDDLSESEAGATITSKRVRKPIRRAKGKGPGFVKHRRQVHKLLRYLSKSAHAGDPTDGREAVDAAALEPGAQMAGESRSGSSLQ
jgi:hypothetical protein